MRKIVVVVLSVCAAWLPVIAGAHGCIKGAAVGGVAGHLAGHHAVAGAAIGCAVGHHEAKVKEKQGAPGRTAAPPPAPTKPVQTTPPPH
jgi:hypothetical protein